MNSRVVRLFRCVPTLMAVIGTTARRAVGASALAFCIACASAADDPLQATLAQRSALHDDPTLEAPLTQLVDVYRQSDRVADLVGMYRAHLAQYPQDANATVVLVRLLSALRDPGALAAATQAADAFPTHAYLRWLQFQALSEAHDTKAIDALAAAVALETVSWRRTQWTERLIAEAVKAGRRDLAEQYLAAAATAETSAAGKLAVARRQLQAGLAETALATLTAAAQADPSPETGIDIQVEAVAAEVALDRRPAAAARLDALLAKLGPEHWRRAELTRRRLELAGGERERDDLIAAARAKHTAAPDDETATLDYARLLVAADRRRDALAVLTQAPAGARLDNDVLALHARLHDPQGLDAWLAARLASDPTRTDLALRRVRTLIDLGRSVDADALVERTAAALPATERIDRLLALARDLRRDGRAAEAARVLERLSAEAPTRMDLVRELAEAWLAAGDRGRAESLLGRDLPADTPPEHVLEAVQLVLRERQYRTALRLITARLAIDPGFFELRIQAVRVAARCGDVAGAERAAAEARALADTPARYRLWLDAAVEAVGSERDEAWLDAEGKRLATDTGWSSVRGDRVLAFAEVCVARDRSAPAAHLLDGVLADSALPAEARPALRRRLVALLERLPDGAERLPTELAQLAAEDPATADECRARTALLAVPADTTRTPYDVAAVSRALTTVNPESIADAALVQRMRMVFEQAGEADRRLACLHRLTVIDPATAAHWEDWLEALAQRGDEDALRAAVRRLLAGVENLTLTADVRTALASRLADSCWRSAVAAATTNDWPGVLALLEQADVVAQEVPTHRWIATARAIALHHLGRTVARDQAMADLTALLAAVPLPKAGTTATPAKIAETVVFPDGLAAGVDALRSWFARPAPPILPPVTRVGPLPPWRVAWSATTTGLLDGVWLTSSAVVVATADGAVLGLSRDDGRLRWRQQRSQPAADPTPNMVRPWNAPMSVSAPARPAVRGEVVAMTGDGGVVAVAAIDGHRLWASSLVAAQAVAVCADVIVAWDDRAGVAAGFDPDTGRLRWRTTVPIVGNNDTFAPHPALTVEGGMVQVMGRHVALLDGGTGSVRWSFTTEGVVPPKPTLNAAPAAPSTTSMPLMGRGPGCIAFSGPSYYPGHRMWAPPGAMQDQNENPWYHVVAGRAMAVEAEARLIAGHLLIGDFSGALALPYDLPLHSCTLPVGQVLGSYGSRVALLAGTTVTVVDLARDGAVRATIDVAAWCGAPNAMGTDVRPVWLSGVADGRWVWLGGPMGVAAIDLEYADLALHAPWPAGIVPVGDERFVRASPNGLNLSNDATSGAISAHVGLTGAVAPGLLVLPAGTRRLVLLRDDGAATDGTSHAR